MSNQKIANELVSLIPHGGIRAIHDKLSSKFESKEMIAYENIKKLILGKIPTKVEQRKEAIKAALFLIRKRKERINKLLTATTAA